MQVAVHIARTGSGTGQVSATYATADGTAIAGTDYTATSGTLAWATGDTTDKSFSIPLLSGATAGRAFNVELSAPAGATIGAVSSATVSIIAAAPAAAGLSIISRGVPAYASSGMAAYANDGNYNDEWRSSGAPATLAYDLSAVKPAVHKTVLLVWYNDSTYGYDHSLLGQAGYNNPGSYTIEVNSGAGGGAPPASGWTVVATVAGNTLHSKEHLINFAGYNWVRMNATASDGSAGNTDIGIQMDVYDASNGVADGWFFGGDSITANCLGHRTEGGSAYDSFQNEVQALKGLVPPQENAGMAGWDALTYGQHLAAWLGNFPGKYVTLNLGTNDAAGAVPPSTFFSRMNNLVQIVLAAGKTPVVPTIPWSREPTHAANIPGLNAQIQALYATNSKVVPGPDLFSFFKSNPAYISPDNVHPTAAGCGAMRSAWAQFSAAHVY